jgi:hypothetical protein
MSAISKSFVAESYAAGESSLASHAFSSPQLSAALQDLEVRDSEKSVAFRLNQTGNIFYSTTSPELNEKTKDLFDSVTVLFSAMTAALQKHGKSLADYDAWGNLLRGCGYFIEVQKMYKTVTIKKHSLSVNTQIIAGLLPGLITGPSMEIAKNILGALNGEFSLGSTTEDTKLAHLLFICEELFGAPTVTVRLFYATKRSHEVVTSSPCHKSSSKDLEMNQQADTFLFVSPETIAQYANKFSNHPGEYNELIDTLASKISPN